MSEVSRIAVIARNDDERCEESEAFGRCSLRAGHDGIHIAVSKAEEVAVLHQQLRGAVQALERIRGLADLHPGDWPTVGRRAVSQAQQALDRLGGQ